MCRQTRELEKTDFVTEENAIPMAKLTDYAKVRPLNTVSIEAITKK
jgi:hypothetical protein